MMATGIFVCLLAMILGSILLTAATAAQLRQPAANEDVSATTAHHHNIHVNFDDITFTSKTTATLQVVSNPILDKKYSPVADTLFDNLSGLGADLVRYAAWFPYPTVGVAELEPPDYIHRTTSWKFGDELQQQFLDVWNAVVVNNKNNRLVMTFSTQPAWMFNTTDWSYSNDTSRSDWGYAKGSWMPSTTELVADYYARFAQWLVDGEFQDEFGNVIGGGPKLGLGVKEGKVGVTHWEIFNEPEAEHRLKPYQYNLLYDAIVQAIRKAVDPTNSIEFFGMALSGHHEWNWWEEFLTLSNHAPEARDAVQNGYTSFHFYASPSSRTNVSTFVEVWPRLYDFLDEVDDIIQLRNRLSPTTKLAVNEAGVIPPDDNKKGVEESPPIYYNMVAALYTVLLVELTVKGVDLVGSSQFCGCPEMPVFNIPDRQYPGVSMTNWTTGSGNPRYWALKLILDQGFGPGNEIVQSSVTAKNDDNNRPDVYAQGLITRQGQRKVILVNKSDQEKSTSMPSIYKTTLKREGVKYRVSMVDETTHDEPWMEYVTQETKLILKPFAVAVITIEDEDKTGEALM
jgi:hypothetical protein